MKTDTEIRAEGMRLLMKGLREVNAERFLALMNREKFITKHEWTKSFGHSQSNNFKRVWHFEGCNLYFMNSPQNTILKQ
jgi:hypothetical protein